VYLLFHANLSGMLPQRPCAFDPNFVPPGGPGETTETPVRPPEHHSQICPTCGHQLTGHRCKLVCTQCGYYLSRADYY
jgi:hypothetical protein